MCCIVALFGASGMCHSGAHLMAGGARKGAGRVGHNEFAKPRPKSRECVGDSGCKRYSDRIRSLNLAWKQPMAIQFEFDFTEVNEDPAYIDVPVAPVEPEVIAARSAVAA